MYRGTPVPLSVAQRTLSEVTTDPSALTTRSVPCEAGDRTKEAPGAKAPAEARANTSDAALASPLATILLQ